MSANDDPTVGTEPERRTADHSAATLAEWLDTDDTTEPTDAERRAHYVERLRDRCDEQLPECATAGVWPVHFDHCFRRLCYDRAVGGDWREHVDGRPFVEAASLRLVQSAAAHAVRLLYDGPTAAWRYQEMSLLWRGEIEPADCEHIDPTVVLDEPTTGGGC